MHCQQDWVTIERAQERGIVVTFPDLLLRLQFFSGFQYDLVRQRAVPKNREYIAPGQSESNHRL